MDGIGDIEGTWRCHRCRQHIRISSEVGLFALMQPSVLYCVRGLHTTAAVCWPALTVLSFPGAYIEISAFSALPRPAYSLDCCIRKALRVGSNKKSIGGDLGRSQAPGLASVGTGSGRVPYTAVGHSTDRYGYGVLCIKL